MADQDRTRTGTEDEESRERLLREIDEARARIAMLERQLARKAPSIDLARVEVDPAFLQKVSDINLNAVFWMCQEMIRARGAKGGVILNVGWDGAQRGMEGESGELFAAAKGGPAHSAHQGGCPCRKQAHSTIQQAASFWPCSWARCRRRCAP